MRRYDFTISRRLLTFLAAGFLTISAQSGPAPAAGLTRAQKEEFLLKAKIVNAKEAAKGITSTLRATLSDGQLTHDASIQRIDETKHNYQTTMGVEMLFRDSWMFNVAAYKLDRLLGLNMIPTTVELSYQGNHGSFTWWVDDVLMDEEQRQAKKQQSPDQNSWNIQMNIVNVFDQLIYNTDRNMGNLLLEKLKQLDEATLKKEIGAYTDSMEIKGLLARRDKIVRAFEQKGPSALYTSPRRPE